MSAFIFKNILKIQYEKLLIIICVCLILGCNPNTSQMTRVIFLHHSTGLIFGSEILTTMHINLQKGVMLNLTSINITRGVRQNTTSASKFSLLHLLMDGIIILLITIIFGSKMQGKNLFLTSQLWKYLQKRIIL